jgi:hypothetical protein
MSESKEVRSIIEKHVEAYREFLERDVFKDYLTIKFPDEEYPQNLASGYEWDYGLTYGAIMYGMWGLQIIIDSMHHGLVYERMTLSKTVGVLKEILQWHIFHKLDEWDK